MSNFNPSTSLFAGKTVHSLTLISFTPAAIKGKHGTWLCRCECGNTVVRGAHAIRYGNSQSCGCRKRIEVPRRLRHGLSDTPEYGVWNTMRQRCRNPKDAAFSDYGERGITVCERWADSFANFIADMGRRPSSKHTIERRDNDLGYSPENCYWATMKEQHMNRRTSRLLTYRGRTQTARAWALEVGIKVRTIYHRMNKGWTPKQILTNPSKGRGNWIRFVQGQ